jgi:hypothetical protein
MIEKLVGGSTVTFAESWAANLTTAIKTGKYKSDKASWLSGTSLTNATATAMVWARDSNAFVCTEVMPSGVTALETGDLSGAYYAGVIDTIELQIAKGKPVSSSSCLTELLRSTDYSPQLDIVLQPGLI